MNTIRGYIKFWSKESKQKTKNKKTTTKKTRTTTKNRRGAYLRRYRYSAKKRFEIFIRGIWYAESKNQS